MSMIALLSAVLFQHVDNDIVYAKVDGKDLLVDAYTPRTPNGKIFIAIHGGGYIDGTKGAATGELCRYLSGRGFTCFDINYRLVKDLPDKSMAKATNAAAKDAVRAYDWVREHAKAYGGQPTKIAIGGISTGADIALTVAYTLKTPVQAVVDLWGSMWGRERDIVKTSPSLLIIHGDFDRTVTQSWGIALQNRAHEVDIPFRFFGFEGGHNAPLTTLSRRDTLQEIIESFLHETLH